MRVAKPIISYGRSSEDGYMLVALVVAIFLMLLTLSAAAPRVAKELRREREVEAERRGNQYVRAIQLYYRKFNSYPGSMEQLEKANNIRFLRQRYLDPMTGKADWRMIAVGQNKTTVKGFFGKPLAGIAAAGMGSASGMASPGIGTTPASPGLGGSTSSFGSSSFGSSGPGAGTSTFGASGGTPGTSGTPGTAGGTSTDASGSSGSGSSGTPGSVGSQSATSFSGAAPFMGVGLPVSGDSIVVLNEQTTYQTWEFLYDPRIEQLKAAANLLGGGPPSVGTGSSPGLPGSGTGTSSPFGSGTNPTSPAGGTGIGGAGTAPTGGAGTTPPQQ